MTSGPVVLLSGGTGGAKLARGLLDVADDLTVVANTGDDVWIYGVHVSPDPDLIAYWMADVIDPRGYGVADDTWNVMETLAAGGREIWFNLGDRDLAYCLIRTELLLAGRTMTDANAAVVDALGIPARVLPMSDEHVPTRVLVGADWLPFQEFMIQRRGTPPDGVEFEGASATAPAPAVLEAIAGASVILIGPSNPVISVGPMLALAGMREALAATPAPVVAVSPFVDGAVLKGPTAAFCDWAGIEQSAAGVADWYGDVLDGMVADEPVPDLPALTIHTRMDTPGDRARVAREAVAFARSLTA